MVFPGGCQAKRLRQKAHNPTPVYTSRATLTCAHTQAIRRPEWAGARRASGERRDVPRKRVLTMCGDFAIFYAHL